MGKKYNNKDIGNKINHDYKSCYLRVSHVDFSGGIVISAAASETRLDRPRTDVEPPLPRYRRIAADISSLQAQLAALDTKEVDNQASGGRSEETPSVSTLSARIAFLQTQLGALKSTHPILSESTVTSKGLNSAEEVSNVVHDALKAIKKLSSTAPGEEVSSFAPVTYEVFNLPSATSNAPLNIDTTIEHRIASLEMQLGVKPSSSVSKDLTTRISDIEHKLSLLQDPAAMSNLSARIKLISTEMESVAALSSSKASAVPSVAVDKLLKLAVEADSMATRLPDILVRLCSLKKLHEEGARFSTRFAHVEKLREVIEGLYTRDSQTLSTLACTLTESMNTMNKNVEMLVTRIENIEVKTKVDKSN